MITTYRIRSVYLTNKDVDHRARGTKLLSALLQNLNNFDLRLDEGTCGVANAIFLHVVMCICSFSHAVHYLVTFYCDRLKDNPLVVPHVLNGLVALVG